MLQVTQRLTQWFVYGSIELSRSIGTLSIRDDLLLFGAAALKVNTWLTIGWELSTSCEQVPDNFQHHEDNVHEAATTTISSL